MTRAVCGVGYQTKGRVGRRASGDGAKRAPRVARELHDVTNHAVGVTVMRSSASRQHNRTEVGQQGGRNPADHDATRAFLGGTTWRSCAHRPHLVVRACARSRSGGTGHRANPRRTSSLVVDPLGLRQNVDRHLLDACRFPFPGYAFPGSKLVAPRGDSAGLVWALTELIIGVPAAHQELVRPPQRVRRQRKLDAAGGHRIRPARA